LAKGDLQTAGRKRLRPENARIAKRVAAFCQSPAPCVPEGVQPLNPGFFELERMRYANAAERKQRVKKRGKVRSK
jgi:hypothetical protein